jgi:hypothetical protein
MNQKFSNHLKKTKKKEANLANLAVSIDNNHLLLQIQMQAIVQNNKNK